MNTKLGMKITILTSRYPSTKSPYNHMFVHSRCLEFVKADMDVTVFVCSEKINTYSYQNIQVNELPAKLIIEKIYPDSLLYIHLLNIYPFQKNNGWIIYKHILKSQIPFVFYVHGNEVQKYTARFYEFNYRISDVLKWIKKDILVIPKMRRFVKKAYRGKYIFPSIWMKIEAEKNLKTTISRYDILPNGIDIQLFDYSDRKEDAFKLLTIRSLSQKVYDIEKTIEVMSFLPKQFTLDIYGEGVFLHKYQLLIKKFGLSERVKIIPEFFSKRRMADLFKNYGIFISTTRMDSQGITMMEAMAAGLVVASTDNSSKREFITDGENGILGENAKEIAEKIKTIASDNYKFEKMAKNGKIKIEKLNIKEVTKKEIRILNEFKNDRNGYSQN